MFPVSKTHIDLINILPFFNSDFTRRNHKMELKKNNTLIKLVACLAQYINNICSREQKTITTYTVVKKSSHQN